MESRIPGFDSASPSGTKALTGPAPSWKNLRPSWQARRRQSWQRLRLSCLSLRWQALTHAHVPENGLHTKKLAFLFAPPPHSTAPQPIIPDSFLHAHSGSVMRRPHVIPSPRYEIDPLSPSILNRPPPSPNVNFRDTCHRTLFFAHSPNVLWEAY